MFIFMEIFLMIVRYQQFIQLRASKQVLFQKHLFIKTSKEANLLFSSLISMVFLEELR